jgi:hypothetical protein
MRLYFTDAALFHEISYINSETETTIKWLAGKIEMWVPDLHNQALLGSSAIFGGVPQ